MHYNTPNPNKKIIHVWAPDLHYTEGGIQKFSQSFIEAICSLQSKKNVSIFIKNDPKINYPDAIEYHGYFQSGNWPILVRTFAFCLRCILQVFKDRPALIISTHLHFGPLAFLVSYIFSIPYVLIAHGIDAWRIESYFRTQGLIRADLVLSVSRFTRAFMLENYGLAPDSCRILPNAVLQDGFNITSKSERLLKRYGLKSSTFVILTVCRLAGEERYKGYDQIIRALPKILAIEPDTHYILVGKGPDRPRIEELTKQIGVDHAVTLAGFVPNDELAEHYNLCNVFVMPSKAEGFGIVYLEALACGKPVLAGNLDGSRDAVAEGELGVLIDPDNIDEIADNLIQILQGTHPHPLIYQPEELRKRVIEKFGFESFQKKAHEYLAPFLSE